MTTTTIGASGVTFPDATVQNTNKGIAKAWVNFNASGTILGSYNVASVSLANTSDYTINFTTVLSNANYAVIASCGANGSSSNGVIVNFSRNSNSTVAPTTSACTIAVVNTGTGSANNSSPYVCVAIFD